LMRRPSEATLRSRGSSQEVAGPRRATAHFRNQRVDLIRPVPEQSCLKVGHRILPVFDGVSDGEDADEYSCCSRFSSFASRPDPWQQYHCHDSPAAAPTLCHDSIPVNALTKSISWAYRVWGDDGRCSGNPVRRRESNWSRSC
jgi:hypothetical protein